MMKKAVFLLVAILVVCMCFSAFAEKEYRIGGDYEPGWYCITMGETLIRPLYLPAGTILNLPDDAELYVDEEETRRQELLHLGEGASAAADRYQASAEFTRILQGIDVSETPVWMIKSEENKIIDTDIPSGWYRVYYLGSSDAKMEAFRNVYASSPYITYSWSYAQGTNTEIYEIPLVSGTVVGFISDVKGDTEVIWLQKLSDKDGYSAAPKQETKKAAVTKDQYLVDLQKSWEDRADFLLIDDSDTVDHYQKMTDIEKELLFPYLNAEFEDVRLKTLALDYYQGLRKQNDAAYTYSDGDAISGSQEWKDGYYERCEALYKISQEYGFTVREKHLKSLQTMLDWGKFQVARFETAMDIRSQIRSASWEYEVKDGAVVFPGFILRNNTDYPLIDADITMAFYDAAEKEIGSVTFLQGINLEPGESAQSGPFSFDQPFASIAFRYSNETQNGDFKQTIHYDTKPEKQISWDK